MSRERIVLSETTGHPPLYSHHHRHRQHLHCDGNSGQSEGPLEGTSVWVKESKDTITDGGRTNPVTRVSDMSGGRVDKQTPSSLPTLVSL